MKNTALSHIHKALGAKLVDFAGFNMPLQYEGLNIEHQTVRNGVGVFDVSHMGEFILKGKNALALIQKISSNDASKLIPGKAQYSCMPNDKGGIVDDLIIYMLNENHYMLVVNASNIEKDWNWISKHNNLGVSVENQSNAWSLLAIQGPKAAQAIQSLCTINLSSIGFYNFQIAEFAGFPNIIISATGYTGSGGFEIYVKNNHVEAVWERIFKAGAPWGIKPIGLAARDTLRLEMGYCLYGNDIDDNSSPIEAGLAWITKFNKDFINSAALKKQKEEGVLRKLIAFELTERGVPRKGYPFLDSEGNNIGRVSSGTLSPSLNKGIGLGYISTENAKIGSQIFVQIRKKRIPAKLVKLPFYKG
ncbi:MAG: glycine cleavage system aminomethyltransferase GcvT [Tenacibaculum sp.]